MNVGSLFSGIGGFDLGLERAGMRTVWFCEQDEFCQRVLAKHWPGVPCYEDVRELAGATIQPVDVLCGGFPCQDLSYAGKGAGIDGARSGLWSEYARLIGELRPRYVVVENVSALLARGMGRVLGDLAALGYDAEWDCIPASAVGAPHQRDRVWLVAYPGGQQHESAGIAERRPASTRLPEAYPDSDRGRLEVGAQLDCETEQDPTYRNPSGRHPDGLGDEVADAEVIALRAGLRADEPRGKRGRRPSDGSRASRALADPEGDGRGPQRPGGSDPTGEGERESKRTFQDTDERALQPWRVGGRIAQAGGSEWWSVEPPVGRVAHGVSDRLDQLAALGNALVPQIAEWIGRRIVAYEEGRLAA